MTPYVIGLAGGSCSGKTSLAALLQQRLGADRAIVIPHDAYYRGAVGRDAGDGLPLNFDHPDALDTALLVRHMHTLKAGGVVDIPIYDFVRHERSAEVRRVFPSPFVILEGILLLASEDLRKECDLRVFMEIGTDDILTRRLARDVRDRGRTAESIVGQFHATVRPMHLAYVVPSMRWADLCIASGVAQADAADMVLEAVARVTH